MRNTAAARATIRSAESARQVCADCKEVHKLSCPEIVIVRCEKRDGSGGKASVRAAPYGWVFPTTTTTTAVETCVELHAKPPTSLGNFVSKKASTRAIATTTARWRSAADDPLLRLGDDALEVTISPALLATIRVDLSYVHPPLVTRARGRPISLALARGVRGY